MAQKFIPIDDASPFRRMATGMWPHPSDPTIHGSVDIDATRLLAFLKQQREQHEVKVTITHAVARAVAVSLDNHPELNAKVRFGGRIERRQDVHVFVSVATDGGRDLSGTRIDHANRKSALEMARELGAKVARVRDGSDEHYERSRRVFQKLPWWLTRLAMLATDVITNELHWDLPSQGLPVDPFGSAIVTNVGSFGVDTAFAPLLPIARAPILVLVSEVRDRPWVEQGQLTVRPVLRLCGTFDHRLIDGFAAARLSREISAMLSDPHDL